MTYSKSWSEATKIGRGLEVCMEGRMRVYVGASVDGRGVEGAVYSLTAVASKGISTQVSRVPIFLSLE